jgi:uncharacterized protein DUF5666
MRHKNCSQSVLPSFVSGLLTPILLAVMAAATACGGGGNNTPVAVVSPPAPTASPTPLASPSPTPIPAFTNAQLRIGDAPADRVIDFEVSFGPGPLVATLATGQSFNLTVQNNRWELSHTAGKLEPLSVEGFPQGAITSIQISLSDPAITYLDDAGKLQSFAGSSPQTANVTLNPPLVIGASPLIVTLDINVASTLTYDQATGKVTAINFSGSTFTFRAREIGPASAQQDDDGEIEGVTGKVTMVNGSTFDLDAGQSGASLTFVTDNTTRFNGVTPANLLNNIVKVGGHTRADGSVFAAEVEGLEDGRSGSELEGIIIAEDGPPLSSNPPQITILVQDGNGLGMDPSKIGQTFWVAIDSSQFSNYTIDWGKIANIGGSFNGRDISPGQRVEVELPVGVPQVPGDTTGFPTEIKLEQQAVTGQVQNFNPVTNEFDLSLPADSYITALTKIASIHVLLQPETDMRVSVSNNANVRVRGLLLFTLTADVNNLGPKPWGVFAMIARRITAP